MVRMPIEALSQKTAKAMAVRYILDFKATKTHWVITWSLNESDESENYDRFGMEGGRGWMARLAPVRDELLRGDIRSLYITLWAFYTFNQLIGDIGTFNTHDAFLSAAVTQKIDTAIPHYFLIHDGEFLVNIGFKNDTYFVTL